MDSSEIGREIVATTAFLKLVKAGMNQTQAAKEVGMTLHRIHKVQREYNLDIYAPDLVVTNEKLDKNGIVTGTTRGIRENTGVDTSGMTIKSVTTMPYGGAYVKYENADNQFLDDDYWDKLKKEFAKDIKPVKIKAAKGKGSLKIYTADKHVGAMVEEVSIYRNEYNKEVYKERMGKVLAKVAQIKEYNGEFNHVTVFCVGDNLDGYHARTTRGGHHLPQNMTTREQFDAFLEVERWFFDNLLEITQSKNIKYIATSDDNHSGAFGYTAYKALELYLNLKYPNINTHISKKFVEHVEIAGETIIYTHGKDEHDKKYGLPLNCDAKTETYFLDYMRQNGINDRAKIIKGDLHQFNINCGKFFEYINIPSVFGCSKWIMNNYGYTPPGALIELDNDKFQINLL